MHGGMKGAANEKERLGDIRRRLHRRLHGRVRSREALVLVGQLIETRFGPAEYMMPPFRMRRFYQKAAVHAGIRFAP